MLWVQAKILKCLWAAFCDNFTSKYLLCMDGQLVCSSVMKKVVLQEKIFISVVEFAVFAMHLNLKDKGDKISWNLQSKLNKTFAQPKHTNVLYLYIECQTGTLRTNNTIF